MCPILFRLFGHPIHALATAEIVGFLLGAGILLAADRRLSLGLGPARALLLLVYGALAGKTLAYAYTPANLWLAHSLGTYVGFTTLFRNSAESTATYGALIGVLAVSFVAAWRWKTNLWRLLDVMALLAAAIAPIVHLGGLLEGAGRGILLRPGPLTLRYPVGYEAASSPTLAQLLTGQRWSEYRALFDRSYFFYPLQIHLILGLLLIAAVLFTQRSRLRARPGLVCAQAMLFYGLLRLSTEPFRYNPPYLTRHLNLAAFLSLAFVVAAAAVLAVRRPTPQASLPTLSHLSASIPSRGASPGSARPAA